jgi:hypothetical protein
MEDRGCRRERWRTGQGRDGGQRVGEGGMGCRREREYIYRLTATLLERS